jgi:hypothetical protein
VRHVPAGQRAAEAIAANPQMSDRAIAQEIGVNQSTVSRARKATDASASVDARIGMDGKRRRLPASSKPRPCVSVPEPRVTASQPANAPADSPESLPGIVTLTVTLEPEAVTPALREREARLREIAAHSRGDYFD